MKFAITLLTLTTISLSYALPAAADTPAFDRPGIAFATDIVPRGAISLEQGLPDFTRNSDAGIKTALYSAGTNVRIGLFDGVELQLATALFNQLEVKAAGSSYTEHGAGDSRLGFKVALPSSSESFSWATLGSVTFDTGSAAFSNNAKQYDLGVALALELPNDFTAGFYVNASNSEGENTVAISPSLSFALSETVGAYVEAGYFSNANEPNSSVAGGGLTWMVTPTVQLDASADFGLNSDSPDVTGGFGVSIYFE